MAMTAKITKGKRFGAWETKKFLGEGGNGFVWLALNSNADDGAIKILAKMDGKNKAKVYARFKSEVDVIRANSDIEGILPIVDFYLPEEIADERPWYVMPVAQTLDQYLDGEDFEAVVRAVLEIGKTLIELHKRGICHRDIKPANILVMGGKFYLGDFGLVDYPDKLDLTSAGEQIGAKWTMAPEMKRHSHAADGKAADVYSLAKTMWILLTGRRDGFEGQYDSASINGLNRLGLTQPSGKNLFFLKAPLLYTKPLDDLLRASTDDDPLQRPDIGQFVERLSSWINVCNDYFRHNPLQWQDIHLKLFPFAVPQRAIWDDVDAILKVLNYLGSVDGLNYMLLPGLGGMDMLGAGMGLEPNTIELKIGSRSVYIVKPKRLIFESFDFDWEWNYFRLETDALEATGKGYLHLNRETLVEIGPLDYISRDEWENDCDGDRKFPSNSRLVSRYTNGDFLIVQKTSTYNRIGYTDDGRHARMGTDEFREYIAQKVRLIQQMRQDKRLANAAVEQNFTIDDFIFACLRDICRQEYLKNSADES